jgi:hypothetical protein
VNTGSSVIRYENRFYLCEQAVWYVSATPKGPWEVATSIPKDIQAIPPEYPVYNVKYVYIYESTPEVVYVGYTPGYVWAYPYYGTVVYGTGYYYPGWYGPVYYYPRPVTYGFHAVYNPYTGGWGFGVSVATPGFSFTFWGAPSYGWWGPGGYRPPSYGGGYSPGGGYRPVATPYGGARPATRDNIYARPGNVDRIPPGARPSTRPAVGAGGTPSTRPATRENNVYADTNGNVYRNSPDGWEQRGQGGWNRDGGAAPSTMDRDAQARNRGAERSQSYNNYRAPAGGGSVGATPPGGAPAGGAMPRGGGGGGRR